MISFELRRKKHVSSVFLCKDLRVGSFTVCNYTRCPCIQHPYKQAALETTRKWLETCCIQMSGWQSRWINTETNKSDGRCTWITAPNRFQLVPGSWFCCLPHSKKLAPKLLQHLINLQKNGSVSSWTYWNVFSGLTGTLNAPRPHTLPLLPQEAQYCFNTVLDKKNWRCFALRLGKQSCSQMLCEVWREASTGPPL